MDKDAHYTGINNGMFMGTLTGLDIRVESMRITAYTPNSYTKKKTMYVTKDGAYVTETPNGRVLAALGRGTEVSAGEAEYHSGIWYSVTFVLTNGNDCSGWIAGIYLSEIKPAGADGVTASKLQSFSWNDTSNEEVDALNAALKKYGITSKDSILLFLATCGHESLKGLKSLEMLNKDGTTVGDYKKTERGAEYIQITHEGTHKDFLKSVNDPFSGVDTATYIAQKYPWDAAGWFWTSETAKSTSAGSLNDYAVKYGSSKNVFLITQYFVNGWPVKEERDRFNAVVVDIRDGKVSWNITSGKLYVNNIEICKAPAGWNDREVNYNDAIKYFK